MHIVLEDIHSNMSNLRSGVKWGLYVSSYWPLYLILIPKHWEFKVGESVLGFQFPILSMFWVFLLLSIFVPWLVIKIRKGREADPLNIESYADGNEMLTNYILVYIFPFIILDYSVLVNWGVFVVIWLVIAVIEIQSNRLFVNPVFAALGYRIYEVDDGNRSLILLSRDRLTRHDETIPAVELSGDVYLSTN